MSLTVNGKAYDFSDMTIETLPGVAEYVTSINYDDEVALKPVFGKSRIPLGYAQGKFKGSGSLTILREGYLILNQAAEALGGIYFMPPFPIVVSYGTDGEPTSIDTLPLVKFQKRSRKQMQAESEDAADVTLDFQFFGMPTEAGV